MTHTTTNKPASSWIKDYSWHKDVLYVTFKNNGEYEYYDVPEPVYDLFEKSYSKGSFFNKNIRGQYPYAKVICVDRIAA
ncbi:hypothetical protein A9Q96_00500 [Rhodobacterales bacterium 52_120_T64]|nr:hypothetical protein A9Q96_00500 [Rhodobacterales bacterium 52_120_T64]